MRSYETLHRCHNHSELCSVLTSARAKLCWNVDDAGWQEPKRQRTDNSVPSASAALTAANPFGIPDALIRVRAPGGPANASMTVARATVGDIIDVMPAAATITPGAKTTHKAMPRRNAATRPISDDQSHVQSPHGRESPNVPGSPARSDTFTPATDTTGDDATPAAADAAAGGVPAAATNVTQGGATKGPPP